LQSTLPQQQRPGPEIQHKVLLVDDDAVSLEILTLLLGFDGHEVVRAPDGESALALLTHPDSSVPPDVLLVDMQMPGLSGYELAKKVRAMDSPRRPFLLGMSATAPNDRQRSGFDGFLKKPLDLNDLRVALEPLNAGTEEKASPTGPRKSRTRKPGRDAQLIDRDVLKKLRNTMSLASLEQLYTACLDDSRARANSIQGLIAADNPVEVHRQAHQIKGAASMIGAARIARLAAILELGSGKKEELLLLVQDLLDACDELHRILSSGKLEEFL
jgi:CheY-like chemotaxis protein